jgi:hypothetical protein
MLNVFKVRQKWAPSPGRHFRHTSSAVAASTASWRPEAGRQGRANKQSWNVDYFQHDRKSEGLMSRTRIRVWPRGPELAMPEDDPGIYFGFKGCAVRMLSKDPDPAAGDYWRRSRAGRARRVSRPRGAQPGNTVGRRAAMARSAVRFAGGLALTQGCWSG